MIRRPEIQKIVNGYDDLRIAVLGSHSALEIMDGAKDEGLDTIVFCQKGRETPYQRFDRICLLYTSPSPRDGLLSRMPSSA